LQKYNVGSAELAKSHGSKAGDQQAGEANNLHGAGCLMEGDCGMDVVE
jgi:hypothetical protein